MRSEFRNWAEILRTQNLSSGRAMDPGSRWLLIARASLFPLTITSGAIGGLLAAGNSDARWGCFAIALFALVLAQAASNMINDYLDLETGIGPDEYQRVQNAPHPILSGLISKTGLILAIALVDLLALGAILYLTEPQGWPVAAFALFGLAVVVGYGAPPIQLKHRGLGEPAVALVWGPLMVGGTYFATTGGLEPWILVASLPYSLLVAAVLIGKHIDKIEADAAKGIRTMPALLGERNARYAVLAMLRLQYLTIFYLIATGYFSPALLVVLLAVPSLRRVWTVYKAPRPAEPPPEARKVWPLWYVGVTFWYTRRFGGLFLAGLIADVVITRI